MLLVYIKYSFWNNPYVVTECQNVVNRDRIEYI